MSKHALPCVICNERSGYETPRSGRRFSIRCPSCSTTFRVVFCQVRSLRITRGWRLLGGILETLLTDHRIFKLRVYDEVQDKQRTIEFSALNLLGGDIIFDPLDRIACLYFEGDLVAVSNIKLDEWTPTLLGVLLRLRSKMPFGLGDVGAAESATATEHACAQCEQHTPHAPISRWKSLSSFVDRVGWEKAALAALLAILFFRNFLLLLLIGVVLFPRKLACTECGTIAQS